MLSVDVCAKMCDSNADAGDYKSCYSSVVHQKLHSEAVRGRREQREVHGGVGWVMIEIERLLLISHK